MRRIAGQELEAEKAADRERSRQGFGRRLALLRIGEEEGALKDRQKLLDREAQQLRQRRESVESADA